MSKSVFVVFILVFCFIEASAQFRRMNLKQSEFAFSAEEWQEGYSTTIYGSPYYGPAVTVDSLRGIQVRSGGEHNRIEWYTSAAPDPLPRKYAWFLVEGAIDITNRTRTFRVYINDVEKFVLTSSAKKDWEVKGKQGSELSFHHFDLDKNRDAIGYFLFRLPVEWLTSGAPVQIRVEGEGSNGSVWLVIYENDKAVYHLARKARTERWMEASLTDEGNYQILEVMGPPHLNGMMIGFEIGSSLQGRKVAILRDGRAYASFRIRNSKQNTDGMSLRITADDEILFEFPAIYRKQTLTQQRGNALTHMEGSMLVGNRWKVEVVTEYVAGE